MVLHLHPKVCLTCFVRMRLPRKTLGLGVTAVFLISYLALLVTGLLRYWELQSRGWWAGCPEVSYSKYDPIPSPSQVSHYTCEWLRKSAFSLITLSLFWFSGLLAILKLRSGGKSLISFLRVRCLLFAWLILILLWIFLGRFFFQFPTSIFEPLRVANYVIPFLLPVSWQVTLRNFSRQPSNYLILLALSLLSAVYALAIFATITYRPMIL